MGWLYEVQRAGCTRVGDKFVWEEKDLVLASLRGLHALENVRPVVLWEEIQVSELRLLASMFPSIRTQKRVGHKYVRKQKSELVQAFKDLVAKEGVQSLDVWQAMSVKALRSFAPMFPGVRIKSRVGDKWVWKRKHELVQALRFCAKLC